MLFLKTHRKQNHKITYIQTYYRLRLFDILNPYPISIHLFISFIDMIIFVSGMLKNNKNLLVKVKHIHARKNFHLHKYLVHL